MRRNRRLQRALVERFLEKTEQCPIKRLEASAGSEGAQAAHAKRFRLMVELRKQQILDRVLSD